MKYTTIALVILGALWVGLIVHLIVTKPTHEEYKKSLKDETEVVEVNAPPGARCFIRVGSYYTLSCFQTKETDAVR